MVVIMDYMYTPIICIHTQYANMSDSLLLICRYFGSQRHHVGHLTLAVAVARHDDEVVHGVSVEAEHAVVGTVVERHALPDFVAARLTV